jgi:integrase
MAKKRRGNGEGSIFRRKNGRWVGQYTIYTANGPKRKTLSGKTRAEVVARLADAITDREAGLVFDAGNLTLGEYLNRWLVNSVQDSVRRRTYESYLSIVGRHIVPALGRVRLTALTPAHVQALYRAKLDSGLSPTTVEHIHTTLHRALGQAVRWGMVPRNVSDAVDVPKRNSPEIRPLTPQQARALLAAAQGDPYEALYVLALTTGMRQGELLGLRWEDVDLGRAVVHIRQTLITGYSKQTFGKPKTAHGRRSIKITPGTVDTLTRHRERQRAAGLYLDSGLVFCNRVGSPVHPKNLTDRHFRPLLRRAGLPPIRFHDLRHTAATLLLSRNVHPKVVQELLGHANISITLDTYSHVLPAMQDGAAAAMQDALT